MTTNKKLLNGQADRLDEMCSTFSQSGKISIKLETGFSEGSDDPLADLQLLRFEKYAPKNTVEDQKEFFAVVLSVRRRETITKQINSMLIPSVIVKARIPVVHSHLPAPRSTSDVAIINLYPDFYAFDLEEIGGKIPIEGSIIKVAFDDPKDLGKLQGNGIIKSVVHINPPGFPMGTQQGNSFSSNLLDGSGDILKICADQRSLNDWAKDAQEKGLGIGPDLPPSLNVSPRNPRKLNSPHLTIQEAINQTYLGLPSPEQAAEFENALEAGNTSEATRLLFEQIENSNSYALVPPTVAEDRKVEYVTLLKEYQRQKRLAEELGQPVPPKPPELIEVENSALRQGIMLNPAGLFGFGNPQGVSSKFQALGAAAEAGTAAVQSVVGEESTLGQITEFVLQAPEYLIKKTVGGISSLNPNNEIEKNRANARKALERALASQNKNRVGYGQNKAAATPPNTGLDCAKIYSLGDFASENLKEYREAIEELDTTKRTWDFPTTDGRIATLHPKLRAKAFNFIKACEAVGIFLRITSGFRSYSEQDQLYAKGRTVPNDAGRLPGATVTNARGGRSVHNFGLAIDVVEIWNKGSSMKHYRQPILRNGRPSGRFKSLRAQTGYDSKYPEERWQTIGRIAQSFGFFWGFHFSSPKDRPHFHDLMGKKVRELDKIIRSRGRQALKMKFRETVRIPISKKNPKRSRRRMIIYPKI